MAPVVRNGEAGAVLQGDDHATVLAQAGLCAVQIFQFHIVEHQLVIILGTFDDVMPLSFAEVEGIVPTVAVVLVVVHEVGSRVCDGDFLPAGLKLIF